jgi:coenzyme F420 hydrogenase subunit beta
MRLDPGNQNYLQDIVSSGLCVGCGLCQGLFGAETVRLAENNYDYFTPLQLKPLSREQRVLLSRCCPAVIVRKEGDATGEDPVWGPCRESIFAHACDPEIRFLGSSGGVVTAICVHLLEQGLADFILHVGASAENPLHNELKVSRCREEVLACAGSRYAPSAPLAGIGEMLDAPGRFAFVGKPCDVAALRQLGRHDSRVGEKVVAMLSFMCAGVPSLRGTYQVLEKFQVEPQQVASFRYRGEGWPGFTTAVLKDGAEHRMRYEESWGTILNRHLLLRCKICPDGSGEYADIVGADAWEGRSDGYPDFAERDGRSLVVARTVTGEELLRSCLHGGTLEMTGTVGLSDISAMQPYQANRKLNLLSRLCAMKVLGNPVPKYDDGTLLRAARRSSLAAHCKAFLGMLRREIKRKKMPEIVGGKGA